MAKTSFTAEPGKQEVVMTRIFDAPREKVFKAFTDPEALIKWWGGKTYTTTVDQLEIRRGGSWRFLHTDKDGNQFAFRGVYHDITAPKRLIFTFEFEGKPGHVLLETVVLEELEGNKTKLTDTSVYQSVEDRDGMVAAGMEEGATEGLETLAELVEAA